MSALKLEKIKTYTFYSHNYDEWYPLQDYVEMYVIGWLTKEECIDFFNTKIIPNATAKDIVTKTGEQLFNEALPFAQNFITEAFIAKGYSKYNIAEKFNDFDFFRQLHAAFPLKDCDKPMIAGQPRRFTKAYIPWETLFKTFNYLLLDGDINNMCELETFIDNKYKNKVDLLSFIYASTLSTPRFPIYFNIAGFGNYDFRDALEIKSGLKSYTNINKLGLTNEDLGILY